MNTRLALLAFASAAWGAVAAFAGTGADGGEVGRLLKERLPRTRVTSVDCARISGLCEVVAGKSLFYVDGAARYLVVGRVYDMQTRQDLTAARLLEINPDQLIGGGGPGESAERPGLATMPAPRGAGGMPAPAQRLDLSGLSPAGGIVWGKPKGRRLTVFSDFRCGYCRALSQVLAQMPVMVIERPISILGSRDLAESVLCAADRAKAVHAAYAGEGLPRARCDTAGLDENESFARTHGLAATPVIVREDGAVLEGFRNRAMLEAWLAETRR